MSAGVIHGINVQEHLKEWWGYGLFFLFAAAAQIVFALILLVQPWRYDQSGGLRDGASQAQAFYIAGAAVNSFFVALYALTRTSGLPFFGPESGRVEPVTFLGLITNLAEVALIVCLVMLIRGSRHVSSLTNPPKESINSN